jgi:hypothetical protein
MGVSLSNGIEWLVAGDWWQVQNRDRDRYQRSGYRFRYRESSFYLNFRFYIPQRRREAEENILKLWKSKF